MSKPPTDDEKDNIKKNALVCLNHFRDGINKPLYQMGFSVAEHCYLDGVLRDLIRSMRDKDD
jgi:hypothetical protein